MSGTEDLDRFRRILVALDASASSLAALEVAAGLAACLRCELAGLFVEDDDLMNLAELPFARAFSLARDRRPWLQVRWLSDPSCDRHRSVSGT